MVKLNCTARNCVNNEGGLCGAEDILIQGVNSDKSENTYCSSFRLDTVINEFKAIGNTNFTGEIMQIFSSREEIKMSPRVNCHAIKCFYNASGLCGARDISIMGDGITEEIQTRCETFVE